MQLTITGRNIEVTPAIKDYATEKMQKIERRDTAISKASVVFHIENVTHTAEGNFHLHGHDFHASAEAEDLYAAIDEMVDKLLAQLTKFKEKQTDR